MRSTRLFVSTAPSAINKCSNVSHRYGGRHAMWMSRLSAGRYSATVAVQNANTTLSCNGWLTDWLTGRLAGWLAGWSSDWPCTHPHALLTLATAARDLRVWRHAECVAQDVLRIGSRGRDWSFNSSMLHAPCMHQMWFVGQADFSRLRYISHLFANTNFSENIKNSHNLGILISLGLIRFSQ